MNKFDVLVKIVVILFEFIWFEILYNKRTILFLYLDLVNKEQSHFGKAIY